MSLLSFLSQINASSLNKNIHFILNCTDPRLFNSIALPVIYVCSLIRTFALCLWFRSVNERSCVVWFLKRCRWKRAPIYLFPWQPFPFWLKRVCGPNLHNSQFHNFCFSVCLSLFLSDVLALPIFKQEDVSVPVESDTKNPPFQYVLCAATSPAVKLHEETLTYLNQGMSFSFSIPARTHRWGFQ